MTKAIVTILENGVLELEEPVTLAGRSRARVMVELEPAGDAGDPTGWKAAERFIGSIRDAPRSCARNCNCSEEGASG